MQIELRAVTKAYGPVRALLGVTVKFGSGLVNVVEGANGSGKSTLLGVLGMLILPSSGEIDYGKLGRSRSELRARLGWVGHDLLCYADLTGRENVMLAATLYGCGPHEAFVEASSRFDLAAFADRPVRTYSRGQRQRIALARALVHKPQIILLDEPTTGLDARGVERLAEVVRAEAKRGALVVLVTHDTIFAERIADQRFTLEGGRLRA